MNVLAVAQATSRASQPRRAWSPENRGSSMSAQISYDAIIGFCAGCAKVAFGHPLDTLKARRQTLPRSEWPARSLRDLYRGVTPTLPGLFLYNSTLFAAFGQASNLLWSPSDARPSISRIAAAGALSGVVVSFVTAPIELVRLRCAAAAT